jgi:hypothetical protein
MRAPPAPPDGPRLGGVLQQASFGFIQIDWS